MKSMKYLLYIAIVGVVILLLWPYLFPAEEETTTADGITYYPDGSYSYQTESPGGQINEYNVTATGETTVTTIQAGTGTLTGNGIGNPGGLPIVANTGNTGIAVN